jgi:3',5'-cyclic AMP phosphodiesterase CpdA
MKCRLIDKLIEAIALWLAAVAAPGGEMAHVANGPYLQEAGARQMTILWTSDECAQGIVRYGLGKALDKELKSRPKEFTWSSAVPEGGDRVTDDRTAYAYEARLTGLTPGSEYRYEVDFGGVRSAGSFKTFPERRTPLKFVVFGDSHASVKEQRQRAVALIKLDPAFIIHTGDMTNHGGYEEYTKYLFQPAAEALRRVPVWPARGNHEERGVQHRNVFRLPGNAWWYSFDYGDAHFVCLDSTIWRWEDAKRLTAEMLRWCENDLARSGALWKIVFCHEPPYDIAEMRCNWGRDTVLPILRRHGVDLVMSGHSHTYQRFRPMYWPGQNDRRPITFIVSGGAGGGRTEPERAQPHVAASSSKMHFMLYSIDGQTLTGRALRPDGTELDRFTIAKQAGRPGPAFLAQAVSEEAFSHLERSVRRVHWSAALDGPEPAMVRLTLRGGSRPVKFRFAISEAGSKDFALTAPVHGTVPANQAVAVTVSVKPLRAIGKHRPDLILEYEADGLNGMMSCGPDRDD